MVLAACGVWSKDQRKVASLQTQRTSTHRRPNLQSRPTDPIWTGFPSGNLAVTAAPVAVLSSRNDWHDGCVPWTGPSRLAPTRRGSDALDLRHLDLLLLAAHDQQCPPGHRGQTSRCPDPEGLAVTRGAGDEQDSGLGS